MSTTTFAPLSWPSSPGFAINTLIFDIALTSAKKIPLIYIEWSKERKLSIVYYLFYYVFVFI